MKSQTSGLAAQDDAHGRPHLPAIAVMALRQLTELNGRNHDQKSCRMPNSYAVDF